ncbi:MAG: AarF/ABC1/UbiB kinase family protein [Deltaproteobacteria bacterium]|nr:AarF/ABC1/UbiB kinase family protein [Deltaproteobacteria bacterium]
MRIVRPVVRTTMSLQHTVRDLNRIKEVASVLVRHGLGFVVQGLPIAGFRAPSGTRETTPERLVAAIQELGPTFVKFGQALSTRVDVLPMAYIQALSRLQDDVAPEPYPAIRTQIEHSLGADWSERIRDLEEVPLATGSVAQVHAAGTVEGREVVVKVLRPHVRDRIRSDLVVLNLLAQRILVEFPEAVFFDPKGILKEFERSVLEETDLSIEAANIRRFRSNFEGRAEVYIPEVLPELSTSEVLVMERIRGYRIRDARAEGVDMEAVGRAFLSAAYQMVFEHGFFHADLHPGNVLVLPGGALGLLDFGNAGRLTPEMKDNLVAILFALERGDFRSIARIYYDLGTKTARVDYDAFERDVTDVMERHWVDRALQDVDVGRFLKQLADGAIRHRIRAPANYTVLFRALLTTEGLARALLPEVDPVAAARPWIDALVKERFRPARIQEETFYSLVSLRTLLRRLPGAVSQVLDDLQDQRLRVEILHRYPPEAQRARNLRHVQTLVLAMSVASLIAGSIALQQQGPAVLGVPWVSWILFGSSGVFWLWTLILLFLNRNR